MLRAAFDRIKALHHNFSDGQTPAGITDMLTLLQADVLLSRDMMGVHNINKVFRSFCKLLHQHSGLIQSVLCIRLTPNEQTQWMHFRRDVFTPVNELTSLLLPQNIRGRIISLQPDDRLSMAPNPHQLVLLPLRVDVHDDLEGWLACWMNGSPGRRSVLKPLHQLAVRLAERMAQDRLSRIDAFIENTRSIADDQIKKIIQSGLDTLLTTMGCDYSVALVLNRAYSEFAHVSPHSEVRKQVYEVVTEYVRGHSHKDSHRSKATGFWIDENEGLLAEAVRYYTASPIAAAMGVSFHLNDAERAEYTCLETGERSTSLLGCEDEKDEITIIYVPLRHEHLLLGFIKLSYRKKVDLNSNDRRMLQKLCVYLGERIRHSFIYSLTVEQSRFLPTIKGMFEQTDQLELRTFEELGKFLTELTGLVAEIARIETLAIGYITKNSDGEKVIRFPHPKGWDSEAQSLYREISTHTGLAGLAVRIKRSVYLSPVEAATKSFDPDATVYIDESVPQFVDIRKKPQYKNDMQYRRLCDYYVKVRKDKVYANYAFLIEYKSFALGVIDVEVTRKDWDRFIGIGYLHFFRNLANMLALLFYRIRLAEEHARILHAVRWMNDAVFVSPRSVVKAVLEMLQMSYRVERAKIILGNINKRPIEINLLEGPIEKYSYLFRGYENEEIERFVLPKSRIDGRNAFLLELKHHFETNHIFYLYIPDIKNYTPQSPDPIVAEKMIRFRAKGYFCSYLGIVLGDKSESTGILELVSRKKNAFEELLIDRNFLETWVSQINTALKNSRMEESLDQSPPLQAPVVKINPRRPLVDLLPMDKIEEQWGLVGSGPSLAGLRKLITRAGHVAHGSILILGESGTGKELVARAIHQCSNRDSAFVPVDCGSLTHELLSDTLFGHVKGAFTGATEERKGVFEQADGGTLFLDEIGNLSLEMQTHFLRVLQDLRITRLGAQRPQEIDTRVLAATNSNLFERTKQGLFRRDLYHRLDAFSVRTIPLRKILDEHESNLLQLISYILQRDYRSKYHAIQKSAFQMLHKWPFEGNVRDLENIIRKAVYANEDGDGVLKWSIPDWESDTTHVTPTSVSPTFEKPALDFIRKYHRRYPGTPVTIEVVVGRIRELLPLQKSKIDKVRDFLNTFQVIDIGIATLLCTSSRTWTRHILKQELNLHLDPASQLYGLRRK